MKAIKYFTQYESTTMFLFTHGITICYNISVQIITTYIGAAVAFLVQHHSSAFHPYYCPSWLQSFMEISNLAP